MPEIARFRQEIMNLVGNVGIDTHALQSEIYPDRLDMVRIKVHHHQYNVNKICCGFAVANQLIVVHIVKIKALVALKRGVVVANTIDSSDQMSESVRPFEVPLLDLILF